MVWINHMNMDWCDKPYKTWDQLSPLITEYPNLIYGSWTGRLISNQ
jgi:hypothetical protein